MGHLTTVAIAEGHSAVRQSLAALLRAQPDMTLVGVAADREQTLRIMQERHPEVLLLDYKIMQAGGFITLSTLNRAANAVAFIVMSDSLKQKDTVEIVRRGARGLVLKSDDWQNLLVAIRTVAGGDLAFSSDAAQERS